jgi:hypothetical protein
VLHGDISLLLYTTESRAFGSYTLLERTTQNDYGTDRRVASPVHPLPLYLAGSDLFFTGALDVSGTSRFEDFFSTFDLFAVFGVHREQYIAFV